VDEHTTLLMSMDGHLRPTVRGFGLWSKNGSLILQDPAKGQGLEVWDGSTRKVLIGRLDDGTIGQEIVGGKLYSSTIRSGGKTDTSYIELAAGGTEPLRVVQNGKTALNIWTSAGGMVQWYDTNLNDMVGQILPYDDSMGRGLRIQGRSNSALDKSVHIAGYGVDIEAYTGIVACHGNFDVFGGTKYCVEQTESYGNRGLSARESPEIRYIDEEKAMLINGECTITIDPIFMECIEPDSEDSPWLIHLTPYADVDLFVAEIGADYFVVRERNSGTSNSVFVWSLSAVRKGYANYRLQEVF
jgi:hypothetical protein